MHVPSSERLEEQVRLASPDTEYVAYLISYNPANHTAVVNSRPDSKTGIVVSVSGLFLNNRPSLVNVRVHVRKIGNYPPTIVDVL